MDIEKNMHPCKWCTYLHESIISTTGRQTVKIKVCIAAEVWSMAVVRCGFFKDTRFSSEGNIEICNTFSK